MGVVSKRLAHVTAYYLGTDGTYVGDYLESLTNGNLMFAYIRYPFRCVSM